VRSRTKSLNSLSTKSAQAIVASLSEQYSDVILTNIDTTEDLDALIERKPDLVFLGMMYVIDPTDSSKKVWLSERLEQALIPHTGSTRPSHELERRKDQAKQRIIDHGLATARFRVVNTDQSYEHHDIGIDFPLFVKPASGGGGKGVDEYSIVRTPNQLRDKISSLRTTHNTNVLIEQYLEGREFSVAVIKDQASDKLIAMPLELIAPQDANGARMLGHQVKTSNQEQVIGVDNHEERELINTFALNVFRALGARDYGRIDIRFDSKGVPHFLEANLIPSLISGYGSFPKAYKLNQGVEYDEMISNIVMLGLSRAPVGIH
jgi:D-alanine-D-alanine ligase